MMNTSMLIKIKNEAEIKANKIERLLDNKQALETAIDDLKYIQHHAGLMIFTGYIGKINERDVPVRTVKVNTLSGCVAVPKLLIELAENELASLDDEAINILWHE